MVFYLYSEEERDQAGDRQSDMLTDIQYKSMCKRLAKIVVRKEDWVNIYPLCTECFARIEYIPPVKKKEPVKIAVV